MKWLKWYLPFQGTRLEALRILLATETDEEKNDDVKPYARVDRSGDQHDSVPQGLTGVHRRPA